MGGPSAWWSEMRGLFSGGSILARINLGHPVVGNRGFLEKFLSHLVIGAPIKFASLNMAAVIIES